MRISDWSSDVCSSDLRKRVCLSSVSQTHHSELHMAHPSGNPDRPSVMQAFSGLSNDEFDILGNADRFAQAELYPLAQRMDDEEWWPPEISPKIGQTRHFAVTAPGNSGGA